MASCVTSISRSARRGISPIGIHAAPVAVPAVEDQRHVDIDDVALLQRLVAGNAVADHVVERGAGRFLVAAVHQRRRQGAVIHRVVEHQPVDLVGRHAGHDLVGQHVEAARHQLAGLAHALEGFGAVQLDLAGFAEGGEGGVDVGHRRQCKAWARAAQARQLAIRPPSSSSICARMMSSNVSSTVKPSASARRGVEAARPAGDDARHQFVGRAADARGDLVAGDALERRDLLADGAAYARHGEIDAGPSCSRDSPAAWMRKPTAERGLACHMQHAVGDRQHRLLSRPAARG